MNTKTKLEQVLELVINEETDKASDLLHDIFVEKSRAIYADLIEEDAEVEEVIEEEEYDFEDGVEEDADEIEAEESTIAFEDEEEDAEMELADELVGDEEGEEMEDGSSDRAEDAMMNVEDALAELKAAFAELTGGESEEEMDMEMDMDSEEDEEVEEDFAFESEELDEAAKLTAVNVSHPDGTDNGKSTVAGKNDMGGSAKNIAQGSAEEKGRPAPKGASLGVDGPQEAGKEPRAVKK